MVDPGTRFRVSSSNIVHEEIDGETIVINLAGGCYYSLSGGGPSIWSRLVVGASADDIIAALASAPEDVGEVRGDVMDLMERLFAEALIAPVVDQPVEDESPDPPGSTVKYARPVLEKYDDLKDYFLIDPIHEVDTAGWPHTTDAA